jgi:hypothetical protein
MPFQVPDVQGGKEVADGDDDEVGEEQCMCHGGILPHRRPPVEGELRKKINCQPHFFCNLSLSYTL